MKQYFPSGPVVENVPANTEDMGRSLVQKDPTCHGATKPKSGNYQMLGNKRCQHNEKSVHQK